MSILDIILTQKIIIISLAAAMLPLLVAILLALAAQLKKGLAARRERRRAAAQRRIEALANRAAELPEGTDPQQPAAAEKPTAPQAAPVPAKPPLPQPAAPAPAAEQPAAPAPEGENAASAAMQDILSSVFTDDEALSQFDVLLEGTTDIDASDLVALSSQIAGRLRVGSPPAVKSKEH